LDYKTHRELIAYTADGFERLKYEYSMCKKKGQPFVVYSHYWTMQGNSESKALLKKIYEYAIADGAELVSVSECMAKHQ
jgi:hypothetical protein